MVEARIKMLPDYVEAETNFEEEHNAFECLPHSLFDVATDWFDRDESGTGHGSADEAATEAEIDSGAEDASGLRTNRKYSRRLSAVFE